MKNIRDEKNFDGKEVIFLAENSALHQQVCVSSLGKTWQRLRAHLLREMQGAWTFPS